MLTDVINITTHIYNHIICKTQKIKIDKDELRDINDKLKNLINSIKDVNKECLNLNFYNTSLVNKKLNKLNSSRTTYLIKLAELPIQDESYIFTNIESGAICRYMLLTYQYTIYKKDTILYTTIFNLNNSNPTIENITSIIRYDLGKAINRTILKDTLQNDIKKLENLQISLEKYLNTKEEVQLC